MVLYWLKRQDCPSLYEAKKSRNLAQKDEVSAFPMSEKNNIKQASGLRSQLWHKTLPYITSFYPRNHHARKVVLPPSKQRHTLRHRFVMDSLSIHPWPGRVFSNPHSSAHSFLDYLPHHLSLRREAAAEAGNATTRGDAGCAHLSGEKHPRVKRCWKVALRPCITAVLLLYLLSLEIDSNFGEKWRIHGALSLVLFPFLSMKTMAAFSELLDPCLVLTSVSHGENQLSRSVPCSSI